MFPTDFITYSCFCVVVVMSEQTKGWGAAGEREEQNLFILLLLSDECRRSRRAGARGPRTRPGADLRPHTTAASSAPFVHPNISSSGAPLLRSLSASPILRWAEEQTPPRRFPSSPPLFLCGRRIITVRPRHVHANGLTSTALEHLVYSIHRTPFLSTRHAEAWKAWPSVDIVNVSIGKREYLASYFCRI